MRGKKVIATPLYTMEQKPLHADMDRLLVKGITQYERLIGSGRFGKVFEVKYHGTICAAKEIQVGALGLQEKELESFKDQYTEQCCKYSMLRHPNILQFLGICDTLGNAQPPIQEASDEVTLKEATDDKGSEPQMPFVILTELMASNLTSLLEKHKDIPLHVKLSILHDVSLGLNYLHSQTSPFVHGRLYSNNILLSAQLVAKVGDFELPLLAKSKGDTFSPGVIDFMPPVSEDVGTSTDAFCYGGVVLHTITQQWPLPEDETSEAATPLQVDRRKKYLEKLSGELKLLTISCLDDDPKSRPTAAELVESVEKVKNERKSPFADMNPITWLAEVDTLSSKLEDSLLELDEANQALTEYEELIGQLQEQLGAKSDALKADLFSGKVKIKWEGAASAPVGRYGHSAVTLNGLVYVGGGVETGGNVSFVVDVYNPVEDKWGSPIEAPRCGFGMTILNNKLVIVGGKTKKGETSKTVRSLEESNQWKEFTFMPTARYNCTAVGYNAMLLIIGGTSSDDVAVATVELFDTKKARWYTCDDLPKPHSFLQPLVVKNTLYLLGGHHQEPSPAVFTAPLNTVARHRLKCNYYKTPTPFVGSAAAVVAGKFVIMIGGEVKIRTDMSECSEVCALNASSSTWEAIGQLPAGRCVAAAASLTDDLVILIGGRTYKEQHSKTVLVGSFDF